MCIAGEEGKQASFTWLVQRWRGMAAPDNIWGPSIIAAAAAQHQAAAAAAAEAAAAAAASRAKAVSSKSHPASSGTTIREELAAAGNVCQPENVFVAECIDMNMHTSWSRRSFDTD